MNLLNYGVMGQSVSSSSRGDKREKRIFCILIVLCMHLCTRDMILH